MFRNHNPSLKTPPLLESYHRDGGQSLYSRDPENQKPIDTICYFEAYVEDGSEFHPKTV